MRDYYRILQVSHDADPEVVQVAYETLVQRYSTATDTSSEAAREDPPGLRGAERPRPPEGVPGRAGARLSRCGCRAGHRCSGHPPVVPAVPRPATAPPTELRADPGDRLWASICPRSRVDPGDRLGQRSSPTPDLVSRTPVYAAGEVFYLEDFSSVERGYLPAKWTGGEKLIVDEAASRKFVRGFEEARAGHSVVVSQVPFPRDYELEWVVTLGWPVTFCEVSSIRAGLDSGLVRLNESKARAPARQGETVQLSLRKQGPIVELFVDGEEVLVGRYPEGSRTPDSFALELGDGCTLHLIKGTALSAGEE